MKYKGHTMKRHIVLLRIAAAVLVQLLLTGALTGNRIFALETEAETAKGVEVSATLAGAGSSAFTEGQKQEEKNPADAGRETAGKEPEDAGRKEAGKEPEGAGRESAGKGSADAGREMAGKGSADAGRKMAAKGTADAGRETAETETKLEEAEGSYVICLEDIHVQLPEGGRVYDGTDRINLAYTVIVKEAEEGDESPQKTDPSTAETSTTEVPTTAPSTADSSTTAPSTADPSTTDPTAADPASLFTIVCQSRLDSCDAGMRDVLYSFSLETPFPERVKMDPDQEYPLLTVEVKKAVLRVEISSGTKAYMDPADPDHITFDRDDPVTVSGFTEDAEGNPVIPEGYEGPQVDVDRTILKKDSPMYEGREKKACLYKAALVMKRDGEGRLLGNPTDNYVFCEDPSDERYTPGDVSVKRRGITDGKDYRAQGDAGAYVTDAQGVLVVREGTRIHVLPAPGSGYNTEAVSGPLTGDGTYTFRLQYTDPEGRVRADSGKGQIRYSADGSVSGPGLTVSGASGSSGLLFSSSQVTLTASPPSDDRSGIEGMRCRILRAEMNPDHMRVLTSAGEEAREGLLSAGAWQEAGGKKSLTLQEEGIYIVEAEVTDGVGNRAREESAAIVIDRTPPKIQITGVSDKSANAGSVIITVSCSDAAYRTGSMHVSMTAASGGIIPKMKTLSDHRQGASVRFSDFKHRRKADAVYTLSVEAEDLAGNRSRSLVTFSINRFGSTYALSEETAGMLASYFHTQPFPVVFTETNLDAVPSARVFVRRESSMTELTGAEGLLRVDRSVHADSCRYTYTVSASAFEQDGRYEVLLLTSDAAGNTSDSLSQNIPVRFAIDRTAPVCRITGIADRERYLVKKLTCVLEAADNLALSSVQVFVDGRLFRTMDEAELERAEGLFKLTFEEKRAWRTLQARAVDSAGNETWTPEYHFLTGTFPDAGDAANTAPAFSARQLLALRAWIEEMSGRILAHAGEKTDTSADVLYTQIRDLIFRDGGPHVPVKEVDVRKEESSAQALHMAHILRLLAVCGLFLLPVFPVLACRIRKRR